jgi:FkbH-like protein
VLGEDLFMLRRELLTDPRLQPVRLTEEAAVRSELVKAQLDRARMRADISDEAAFIASLDVVCSVEQLTSATATPAVLERVHELIERTTQFNATGRSFTTATLLGLCSDVDGDGVFTLRMSDRLGEHGLVGAAVIVASEILNVVLSCRVIGLGGEHVLLERIIDSAATNHRNLTARIVTSDRNMPVRHLFADNGFLDEGGGLWTRLCASEDRPGAKQHDGLNAASNDDIRVPETAAQGHGPV